MALQRLKDAAEKAKCELSTRRQTEIVLPLIFADANGPKHLNLVLTRTKFEKMIRSMLGYTTRISLDVLNEAGLDPL